MDMMADSTMSTQVEAPTLFVQHLNFSDAINRNIIQSEIEGGVDLRHLSPVDGMNYLWLA